MGSAIKFPPRVRRNMKALRDEKLLFDFTIEIDGSTFPTHKFILACYSDYFKAMFKHNSLESQQDKVHLQDMTVATIEAILDFCYSSNICLTPDNVQEILVAASILQIDEIQNLCVDYIKERVDASNCLGILIVANRCNLSELYQNTMNYCLDKFEDIIEENEFPNLDEFWLSKIISNDRLNVCNEYKVFQAVINWISADPELREDKLNSLMKNIRLPLIEPLKLVSISNHELVRKSIKCRDLIDEAKDFLLLQDYPEECSRMKGLRIQPRVSERKLQRIYAVGGWTNEYKPVAKVEKYDPYVDVWIEVKPMTRPRCGVGVTILDEFLYAIGGHDGQNYLKSAERYDIQNDTWYTDVADMNSERTSVGVVSLGGYIYAIGGQGQLGSTSSSTSKVERYDRSTNTWEECQPMQERRLGAGVTVLNGLIYVMGGADMLALNSVECYDPATDRWTYRAPMTTSRKHLASTSHGGKIYAVGGRGDSSELDAAECYDPELDNWEPIANMSEKRSGIGLVELDNLIYAVGGHNGDVRLNLVEAYDPVSGKWSKKEPMIQDRLGGGLAVYSPMIKLKTYLFGEPKV